MTSKEKSEEVRSIMDEFLYDPPGDQFISATEFYSLPHDSKLKILLRQVEFAEKNKSIFITGIKETFIALREGEDTGRMQLTVTEWLHHRPTSYGEKMFNRVYPPESGVVELQTASENLTEAIDWARLATSEIGKQLNATSMSLVFQDPEQASQLTETQPDWKPHQLGKKVATYEEPDYVQQRRRRAVVTMDFAAQDNSYSTKTPPKCHTT